MLTTAASADLIAQDIAVGRAGDLYAFDGSSRAIVRFAEDKSKPGTANIPGTVAVVGGVAKIGYTLSGVACPAVVGATATLTGADERASDDGDSQRDGRRKVARQRAKEGASRRPNPPGLRARRRPSRS